MEKMREEFESWWISKNPNHTDVKSYWHETGYWVNSNSAYSNLDFAWECWKSSRAALCVELPSFENGSIRGYSGDCDEARMVVDSVAESLGKSGVSYK